MDIGARHVEDLKMEITKEETVKAVKGMISGKVSGMDGIMMEVYKGFIERETQGFD